MKKILTVCFALISSVTHYGYAQNAGKTFKDWKSVCANEVCGIEQLIMGSDNRPQAHAFIRKTNEGYLMHVRVPLFTNLEEGLILSLNGEEVMNTPYYECTITGCTSLVPLTSELKDKMRKGSEMQISTFVKATKNNFKLSLRGLSAGLDSL